MGFWPKRGLYTYMVECSNSMGTGGIQLSVAVGTCFDGNSFIRLYDRGSDLHRITLNIINSQQVMVFQCEDQNALDQILCLEEDVYQLDLLMKASEVDNSPVMVYDGFNNILGSYNIQNLEIGEEQLISERLNLKHLVSSGSTIRYTKNEMGTKWMTKSFNAKDWKESSVGNWGVFDSPKVYFRKEFNLPSEVTYAHFYLGVFCVDTITIYVNNELFLQTDKLNAKSFTHVSIPATLFAPGTNLIAIQLERTTSEPTASIVFDMHLLPLFERCIRYPDSGIVTVDPVDPSSMDTIQSAFDNNLLTRWRGVKFPATVTYTFRENRHEVINRMDIYITEWKKAPSEFSILGIRGSEQVVLKTVQSKTLFFVPGWITIYFSNTYAFNQYAFIFSTTPMESEIDIYEIYLYSCNILTCTPKLGAPAITTNDVYYTKCPHGSVGTRLLKCVDVDNKAVWEEDRSACLPKTPARGTDYVDVTYILYNVTYTGWKKELREFIQETLLAKLNLNQNNTQFSFVRDLTNSTLLTLQFSMRFTLYEGLGRSVQKQLLPYDEELNKILKKKYRYAYKGISIVRTEGPIVRKPISWVVVSCVVIGCIVVCGLVGWLWKKQTTKKKECLLDGN